MNVDWPWGSWEASADGFRLSCELDHLLRWTERLPFHCSAPETFRTLIWNLNPRGELEFSGYRWEFLAPGWIRPLEALKELQVAAAEPSLPLPSGSNSTTAEQFRRARDLYRDPQYWERLEEAFFQLHSGFAQHPERTTHNAIIKMHRNKHTVYWPTDLPETETVPFQELEAEFLQRFQLLHPLYRAALLGLLESWYWELWEVTENLRSALGSLYEPLLELAYPLWKALPRHSPGVERLGAPYALWAFASWPLPLLWLSQRLAPEDLEFLLRAWSGKSFTFPNMHPDAYSFSNQDLQNPWALLPYQDMLEQVQRVWEERLKSEEAQLTSLPKLARHLNAHSRLLFQFWKEWLKHTRTQQSGGET